MALDTTIAGENSNSYGTMSEANTYFTNSPYGASWSSSEPCMIYAATMLDALAAWTGYKTTFKQAREFPRTGLASIQRSQFSVNYDYGLSYIGGDDMSMIIPPEIKHAQFELAYHYQKNISSPINEDENISRIEVGPIRIDMDSLGPGVVSSLPNLVTLVIQKYGKARSTGNSIYQAKAVRS